MYYRGIRDGFDYQDKVVDGNYTYHIYENKEGIILIVRENTSTGEIRFAIDNANKTSYNVIKSRVATAYTYKRRSEINL